MAVYNWQFVCGSLTGVKWYSTSTGSSTLPPMAAPGPNNDQCIELGEGGFGYSIQGELAPGYGQNVAHVYDGSTNSEYFGAVDPDMQGNIDAYSLLVNNTSGSAPPTTALTITRGGILTKNAGGITCLAAGTSSQLLSTNGSGDLAWVTSAASFSATGTANQVLANGTSGTPQTGAVTFSLPQSIATSSSPQFAALSIGTLKPANYANRFNNSVSVGSGVAIGTGFFHTLTRGDTSNLFGMYSQPTFAVGATTGGVGYGVYLDVPQLTGGGNLGAVYNMLIASAGTGSTNSCALYAHSISCGANAWTTADNADGYMKIQNGLGIGANPSTTYRLNSVGSTHLAGQYLWFDQNSLAGPFSFGSTDPTTITDACGVINSTFTSAASTNNYGVHLIPTLQLTSPNYTVSGLTIQPTLGSSSANVTTAMSFWIRSLIRAGYPGSGIPTIDSIYTAYVDGPAAGASSRSCALFAPSIYCGSSTPGSNYAAGMAYISNLGLGLEPNSSYSLLCSGTANFIDFVCSGNARFNGLLGIGTAPSPDRNIYISGGGLSTRIYTIYNASSPVRDAGHTGAYYGYQSHLDTASMSGTNTCSDYYHVHTGSDSGVSTAITRCYGLYSLKPTAGSALNVAAYTENCVIGGDPTVAPPSNGLFVQGNIKNDVLSENQLVATDGSKQLVSTNTVTSLVVTGTLENDALTATQLVATNGSKQLTSTTSSITPTFAGLTFGQSTLSYYKVYNWSAPISWEGGSSPTFATINAVRIGNMVTMVLPTSVGTTPLDASYFLFAPFDYSTMVPAVASDIQQVTLTTDSTQSLMTYVNTAVFPLPPLYLFKVTHELNNTSSNFLSGTTTQFYSSPTITYFV